MKKAPDSVRLHIALTGRMNVGKSSFMNLVTGQNSAITDSKPGTTTDVVEKKMELRPLGPVLFLDTAGIDDKSSLAGKRLTGTRKIIDRADVIVLITTPGQWGKYEQDIVRRAGHRDIPLMVVVNKIDLEKPSPEFLEKIGKETENVMTGSSKEAAGRDKFTTDFKDILINICPEDFIFPPPLAGDLLEKGGMGVLITPIDIAAPKGRLILPQVQTIRDILDSDSSVVVTKETEYPKVLDRITGSPQIVICDSQVVDKMVEETPDNIPCTTFSIIFSRNKGDLSEMVRGVAQVDNLKDDDRVLIAEACTHHPTEDDIGRVKIPRWIRKYTGKNLKFDVSTGKNYPDNLEKYSIIVHCGGCMINRRFMLSRIQKAKSQGVPVTNYGVLISRVHGVLERVLSPFEEALNIFKKSGEGE
ncbi:MAG: [FeFe] hydrogenase H-cluster maturation GTPase HydF [Elusimicrobiota bacterium]